MSNAKAPEKTADKSMPFHAKESVRPISIFGQGLPMICLLFSVTRP